MLTRKRLDKRKEDIVEESIVKKINEDPEFDLIPQKDVSLLKIKLGKGHRKESDWDVIKEILTSHELIVAEPSVSDDFVSAVNHVMACGNRIFAFTNAEDCYNFLKYLCNTSMMNRDFEIGTMPFYELTEIAEENQMFLYIDMKMKTNSMCIAYDYVTRKLLAFRVTK